MQALEKETPRQHLKPNRESYAVDELAAHHQQDNLEAAHRFFANRAGFELSVIRPDDFWEAIRLDKGPVLKTGGRASGL